MWSGFEEKSLSNPHFRSSLSGLQHSAKVLRVFFCRCDVCWREKLSAGEESCNHSVAHKSFHVTVRPVPCSRLDLSCCDVDLQIRLEPSVLSQVNDWIASSGMSQHSLLSILSYLSDHFRFTTTAVTFRLCSTGLLFEDIQVRPGPQGRVFLVFLCWMSL